MRPPFATNTIGQPHGDADDSAAIAHTNAGASGQDGAARPDRHPPAHAERCPGHAQPSSHVRPPPPFETPNPRWRAVSAPRMRSQTAALDCAVPLRCVAAMKASVCRRHRPQMTARDEGLGSDVVSHKPSLPRLTHLRAALPNGKPCRRRPTPRGPSPLARDCDVG